MGVSETRVNPVGVRRRRRCVDLACSGRITTVEIQVMGDDSPMRSTTKHMLVPAKSWRALNVLAQKIRDSALPLEVPNLAPDDSTSTSTEGEPDVPPTDPQAD